MAEAFGIVSGALSIASLFNNCVECFEYIQLGRKFGRDFERCQLRLDVAKTRLGRWGEAVKINDHPLLDFENTNQRESQLARSILEEIMLLFESAQKTSDRYQITAKKEDQAVFEDQDMTPVARGMHNRFKALAKRRQKGASLTKKAGWALYDAKMREELIEKLMTSIKELEDLIPADLSIAETSRQLADAEITEVTANDELTMIVLSEAAEGLDPVLTSAIEQKLHVISGQNSVKDVNATENATVLLGNDISNAIVSAFSITTINSAENVTAKDKARVHIGNRIGTHSFL